MLYRNIGTRKLPSLQGRGSGLPWLLGECGCSLTPFPDFLTGQIQPLLQCPISSTFSVKLSLNMPV